MDIPDDVVAEAKRMFGEIDENNSMIWNDEYYKDALLEAISYTWRMAHAAGYREGCEDSY